MRKGLALTRMHRLSAAFAAFVLLASAPAGGQTRPSTGSPGRSGSQGAWRFDTSPAADLWFHGLAMAGSRGLATTLYAADWAAQVEGLKREAGVPASALDTESARFRDAFERDSAFEVLHFLPLALPVRDPASFLTVLRAVARGVPAEASRDETIRRVAGAIAGALPDPGQRKTLARFVDALEDEWRTWLRPRMEKEAAARAARAAAAQQEWARLVEPKLRPWLESGALRGGVVLLTPALGSDGRFSEGDPADPADNLVVVRDSDPGDVVAATLRELCYPTVRRAITRSGVQFTDRIQATRTSDAAATRCGALLAARVSRDLLARYEDRFTAAIADRGGFTLPPAIEAALLAEIERRME